MLPEIFAEVLHFLSRWDLDKACAINEWFDSIVAQCCEVYPLRLVHAIELIPSGNDFMPNVLIDAERDPGAGKSFSNIDEAVHFAASLLRLSYTEDLMLGIHNGFLPDGMTLFPDHWKTLSGSAIRRLSFRRVDLSALDNDVFLDAAGCHGLQFLVIRRCIVRSGFVSDDLIRPCAAKGLNQLWIYDNESDSPHVISDEAVLDYFFPADSDVGRQSRSLKLDGTGITHTFLAKFLECILSKPVRPSGSLDFKGAAKQSGLSAYARYLASGEMPSTKTTYRFSSVNDSNEFYYEVALNEETGYTRANYMQVTFGLKSYFP